MAISIHPSLLAAPTYLRVPEVANILNISRTQAYRLVQDGVLPHIRLGRSVRVPYKALMDYLAQHEVAARNDEPCTA